VSLLSKCSHRGLDPACSGRCVYRCGGCGLHHLDVECGGIFSCPSPLCPAAGGAWSRDRLASYRGTGPGGQHQIDALEWVQWGLAYLLAHPELGPDIAAAAVRQAAVYTLRNPGALPVLELQ
jgi:hypothetical protein